MAEFLEERLSMNIDKKSSWGEMYHVEITETANGNESRRLTHPFPRLRYDLSYQLRTSLFLLDSIVDLYHRAYGKFAGFRVRNLADHSTNGHYLEPTDLDQILPFVSTGVYQLVRFYGDPAKPALVIGRPKRTIFKPVSATSLISVSGISIPIGDPSQSRWACDTTNGKITFAVDKTFPILNITNAPEAVIQLSSVGSHSFSIGDSVHVSNVTGSNQMNNLRFTVTNLTTGSNGTITIDVDSTPFVPYVSGGVVHSIPQAGEVVRGGCYFDIPCRFDSDISGITFDNFDSLGLGNMEILEILNP